MIALIIDAHSKLPASAKLPRLDCGQDCGGSDATLNDCERGCGSSPAIALDQETCKALALSRFSGVSSDYLNRFSVIGVYLALMEKDASNEFEQKMIQRLRNFPSYTEHLTRLWESHEYERRFPKISLANVLSHSSLATHVLDEISHELRAIGTEAAQRSIPEFTAQNLLNIRALCLIAAEVINGPEYEQSKLRGPPQGGTPQAIFHVEPERVEEILSIHPQWRPLQRKVA